MERDEYVQTRKRQYMAQCLEVFDSDILPLLPTASAGQAQAFKGLVRAKLNALAKDAIDIYELDGHRNGFALEALDRSRIPT